MPGRYEVPALREERNERLLLREAAPTVQEKQRTSSAGLKDVDLHVGDLAFHRGHTVLPKTSSRACCPTIVGWANAHECSFNSLGPYTLR